MSERMEVTTYFLEMSEATDQPQAPCPEETSVSRTSPSARAYLALYEGVGIRWLWYERSELPINELQALIGDSRVAIHTLYHCGEVAGYSEIRRDPNGTTQILYFGLLPRFIGKGLGRYFLDWTVAHAFEGRTKRVRVHTCSLDHSRALSTYLDAGFREYKRESGWVTIPTLALKRQNEELARESG
ncbi:MAG: GNAT family N-acetyltransferase [Kofleriaceae bacterium]|nr:GNAT family N-acetyltransferase [Kofleriaceae bacterium]